MRCLWAIKSHCLGLRFVVNHLTLGWCCVVGTYTTTPKRLFEGTFRLDIKAARDFCAADERWTRAVDVLDANSGAGWDLLQAMMNADWKKRPTVEEVQQHPFFTG